MLNWLLGFLFLRRLTRKKTRKPKDGTIIIEVTRKQEKRKRSRKK